MSWSGSGQFLRLYSWVADKAAGLDISSVRMDADTNDITSNGFGNCLTRDGQGQPTANLPMATFKHTNIGNGNARTDSVSLAQVQDGLLNWTIATGTSDAIVATYTPALGPRSDGMLLFVRATAANATTAPTFSPNVSNPVVIVIKKYGQALAVGDIQPNLDLILRYDGTANCWELLNPANIAALAAVATTGSVMATVETSAPSGWLMLNDTTMGSAASGAASASALNLALFTLLFNNISDSDCPLLTSTGSATTRAGQGTAAAAWSANCRVSLPKMLGRALASAGSGSGLTARALGSTFGEENHLLTSAEMPTHSHGVTDPQHTHTTASPLWMGGAGSSSQGGSTFTMNATSLNSASTGISIQNAGSGGSHNNIQPSAYLNFKIKQ